MGTMKREKQHSGLSAVLVAAAIVIFLPILLIAHAHAEPPVILSMNTLKVRTVQIDGKSDKYNFIFVCERRFRVSPTASILNYRGENIPLKRLPIPCRAKITYHLFGDNRDPFVEKIQLR